MGELTVGEYRRQQGFIAIFRDHGRCVFCYYVIGRDRMFDEVHHVFGRGVKAGDWRDEYTSLLCLCRDCHSMLRPLGYKRGTPTFEERLLERANREPINLDFEEPENVF